MSISPYFSNGTRNEQLLIEDIIIECLSIYGQQMVYIPRQLVAKDDILGEDRLSEFKETYPIEMYFENVDSFDGQGAFLSKFGLMMEQSATLVVSRRRWEQLIGRHDSTILPDRPCEGDLIYFPLTSGLFEIKFVKHQDPFYQLGKLYVYKLQVELFQYASEKIDTGITGIDTFESLKTFNSDPSISQYGEVVSINMVHEGSNYTTATATIVSSSTGTGAALTPVITDGKITSITVTNGGTGYSNGDVQITGDGTGAQATATFETSIDKPTSYGDNNSFKKEAIDVVFSTDNPFGD